MLKKITLIFILTFATSYLLLHAFFKGLEHKQEMIDIHKTTIIQENVKEQFRLLLDLPLSIGLMGADYFSEANLKTKKYGEHASLVLGVNNDILGLNIVDADGDIIRVFPEDLNFKARARRTQNLKQLRESFEKGEPFWFSQPFKLYQKNTGFVFYIPILNKGILKGWFAPVLSAELFFNQFKLREYLKAYELIIKDARTEFSYFETSILPPSDVRVYESNSIVMGRKIIFQSWTKNSSGALRYPWYWSFSMAFILGCLGGLIGKLYENRRAARVQLRDISILLSLTSKEALSSLVDMHSESLSLESQKNVSYLKNLIEQIDLLQTMVQVSPGPFEEVLNLSPIIEKQITFFADISLKKNISVTFGEGPKSRILVRSNRWLLENSVVSNILSHSMIYARADSKISIEIKTSPTSHFISFHTDKIFEEGTRTSAISFDRRLEVAQRILQMYQGELYVQRDLSEGLIIRMVMDKQT